MRLRGASPRARRSGSSATTSSASAQEARGVRSDPGADVEHAAVEPGRARGRRATRCRPSRPPSRRGRAASASATPGRIRAMRVCVLTTSYPRSAGDVAGVFVADAVEHLRAAGVEVDVVSPADFRALRDRLRRRDRRRTCARSRGSCSLVPLFLVALRARGAARGARRRRRARALDPVRRSPRSRRGSRSCSRCGARTSSSRGARRGSRGRSCGARGS